MPAPRHRAPARQAAFKDPASVRHVLTIEGPCNNRCAVCDAPIGAPRRPGLPVMKRGDRLWITGAEPTLHPELFETVARAAGRGVEVRLYTNGRFFYYEEHARRAVAAGLSEAAVPLYGADAAAHERMTRTPGSFAQATAGIRNLARAGVPVAVGVRVEEEVDDLDAIVSLAGKIGARAIWFSVPDPVQSVRERSGAIARVLGAATKASAPLGVLLDYCGTTTDLRAPSGAVECNVDAATGDVSAAPRNWCTNRCVFCVAKNLAHRYARPMPLDTAEGMREALDGIVGRTTSRGRFVFATIEPGESPFLLQMAADVRRAGFRRLELWTHARTLADRATARAVLDAGFTAFRVPVLGPDAATHDEIAGCHGAFEEAMAGIATLRALGVKDVAVTGMVTGQNAPRALDLMRFAREVLGSPSFPIVEALPATPDPRDFARYAFRLAPLARLVEGADVHTCAAFPFLQPCLFKSPREWCALFNAGAVPPDLSWKRGGHEHKAKAPCPKAPRCAWAHRCPGINPQYVALFRMEEFRP